MIDKHEYMEHRLAWFYMMGEWPGVNGSIDHKNRIKNDNRWENLRFATWTEQQVNQGAKCYVKGRRTGLSVFGAQYLGASCVWRAQISENYKPRCLGYFRCPIEAQNAYIQAARALHGDYFNLPPEEVVTEEKAAMLRALAERERLKPAKQRVHVRLTTPIQGESIPPPVATGSISRNTLVHGIAMAIRQLVDSEKAIGHEGSSPMRVELERCLASLQAGVISVSIQDDAKWVMENGHSPLG